MILKPTSRAKARLLALVVLAATVSAVGLQRFFVHPATPPALPAQVAVAVPAQGQAAGVSAGPIGGVDSPIDEATVASTVTVSGWALDATGIERVEVRVDGQAHRAHYGIARPDVARVKPGYPDSSSAGFEFAADLSSASLARHRLEVVAINRAGKQSTLATKSLIPPAARTLWSDVLDPNAGRSIRPFTFLMMLSGISLGGAVEADTIYRPYLSRTQRIGIAVPILYLRTTTGAANDWSFDPDFDLTRRCGGRQVAEDNLRQVMQWAIEKRLPVHFILNGGVWADASCDTPEWDVNDFLEKDIRNCQWTQDNEVFADDFRRNLPGSTESPELGRTLTYNVYAGTVRAYKRRNLKAAAKVIASFARQHPDLFVGVNLDADTYMNPFVQNGRRYDYNPGMLRQFREWLSGSGPYAGKPDPGVPDLSAYRRKPSLTLTEVNRLTGMHWRTWESVDPPRRFDGEGGKATPGETPFWKDPWYLEWDAFRKHVVGLHYDELSEWVHEAGIDKNRIFSAQGFTAPDPGLKPISIFIRGSSPNYDSAGVSIEGSIPRAGHLGAILYGPAAANDHPMENGHSLFATIARMDPAWAIVEMNATDLKTPTVQPNYSQSYHAFRELFNFDAQHVALMAWNGSNGLFAGQPGFVPYTAWRNTPGEAAMRDFLVSHADLPRGARLWSFGAPGYLDDDGWRLEDGTVYARGGYLDLQWAGESTTLLSPPDQVIRTNNVDRLTLGLTATDRPDSVRVYARTAEAPDWRDITGDSKAALLRRTAAGWEIPLHWPAQWRARNAIADGIKVVLQFRPGIRTARLDRIALYPAAAIASPWRKATSPRSR